MAIKAGTDSTTVLLVNDVDRPETDYSSLPGGKCAMAIALFAWLRGSPWPGDALALLTLILGTDVRDDDHHLRWISLRPCLRLYWLAMFTNNVHKEYIFCEASTGDQAPAIRLSAREAGAECCDTLDASPIQHKAANKSAWLMNGHMTPSQVHLQEEQTRTLCTCRPEIAGKPLQS